jgi:2-methylisocitrate lyase-like PEP mutase family enzyme
MNNFQKFYNLHHQPKAFLLGNVWNAKSAQIYERSGIEALGTSSFAISSSLGYPDGEGIPFNELLFMVHRIVKSISIPLSVDIEAGHGQSSEAIIRNIESLYDLGVVGVNIEDSVAGELKPRSSFSEILSEIANALAKKNIQVFLNARVDPFEVNAVNPLAETINRVTIYQQCGIHGIFVPGAIDIEDIKQIISSSKLPLNILRSSNTPSMDVLSGLGVKRVSLGANAYRSIYNDLNEKTLQLIK